MLSNRPDRLNLQTALIAGGVAFIGLMLGVLLLASPPAAQASVSAAPDLAPELQQGQCPSTTADICGNQICCPGENPNNCPADCGPPPSDDDDQCPEESCDPGYHWDSGLCECYPDSDGFCGDGIPQSNEQCGEPGLGGCANHEGFPPNTAVCVNCRCVIAEPVCGDGVVTPPEACDPQLPGSCAEGQTCVRCNCVGDGGGPICGDGVINQTFEQCDGNALGECETCTANCTCGDGGGPFCGDGVINQTTEQCDGNALGDCETCNDDCTCGGPVCGDGTLDAGEQCETGVACQEDGAVCDISACLCRPGDPCDPVDEGDGGGQPGDGDGEQDGDGQDGDGGQTGDGDGVPGTPSSTVPINRYPNGDGGDGSGGGGQDGDGGDGGDGNGLPGGVDPDPGGDTEDCEEGDCLNPGAGVINTYGGSTDVFAVECCNADGTGCVLHVEGEITVYEGPDGTVQLCSSEFDRYCRPVPGDNCEPTSTDDVPGGGDIPYDVWRTDRELLVQASPGVLASVLPQDTYPPLEGYVCDEPGELCVDLDDAQEFQNTLVQTGYPQDYDGLVLWDCQVPDESETSLTIANNAFPELIVVPIFTEITWTNTDQNPHTVTSDDDLFDSGPMAQGDTFTHDFNLFGDFPYHSEGDEGMTGIIRVVPACEQRPLQVKGGNRACAPCNGDWCGFAPGRPQCILQKYDEMPDLWRTRYDTVEGEPIQDVGDVSDGVYALICPAPPQGRVCIPVDEAMKTLFDDPNQPVSLADCFSGNADDQSLCPVLDSDFTLETDGNGAEYLCFQAGEGTGFEPSCGPHPQDTQNGCAFVLGPVGAGVPVSSAQSSLAARLGDTSLWLILLLLGLFLLIIVAVLALSRRRHVEEE